jgi:DNA-directed RNA polymerase subunit RPC12/RpoP
VNKSGEHVPKKMYPCGHCGRLLTSKTKVQHHIKTVHEGAKDFACNYCAKRFSSKANLKIHEGSIHTGDLPHQCTICNKTFGRKKALNTHIEQSHGDAGVKKAAAVHTITMDVGNRISDGGIFVVNEPYVDIVSDIIM